MEYELNKWYVIFEDCDDLEFVFKDEKNKDSKVGLLMKYDVGLIEFETDPYLRGNVDSARQYFIDSFMLIKY
jgi:hypothetical protein